MTTIAWDGKTLAADRQCTGYACRRTVRKLFDCGEYVFGAIGRVDDMERVRRWLTGGMKESIETANDGCHGLAVHKVAQTLFAIEGKHPVLVEFLDEFHAQGSGMEYALAAMALGKTAVEAVELAARFDDGTGMGVDYVDLTDLKNRTIPLP